MISKEEANQIQKFTDSIITANSAVASTLYGKKTIYSSEKDTQSAVFIVEALVNEEKDSVIW
ncbi:hypothetical protein CQ046_15360 [Chryseobacterium sp. MYb7]|jgi:hypothetical protein|uniref:hypothetical protein n=1 Tax=Chryseobacterium sp. MYb7 TaxID=1827290 RepID=UPI000CFE8D6B|nr:hypothetical protein [Chryseobacterium sp. MYb7]PRB01486.1 hypothetical protein CQ046_15360 [Chryseobacterium sp. MYb7]